MIIYFYHQDRRYGCFSNFSAHSFIIDGAKWKTSEHYFQAHKFLDAGDFDAVRKAATPKAAASMGRDRRRALRPDWEDVKDDIMRAAVLAKFKHHKSIQRVLLSTGDAQIMEKAPRDYYWGIGADGTGKNMLGVILMEVREILRGR